MFVATLLIVLIFLMVLEMVAVVLFLVSREKKKTRYQYQIVLLGLQYKIDDEKGIEELKSKLAIFGGRDWALVQIFPYQSAESEDVWLYGIFQQKV